MQSQNTSRHGEEGEEQTCNYSKHNLFSNFFKTYNAYVNQPLPFKTASEDISTDHTTSSSRQKKGKLPVQITYIFYTPGKIS